MIALIALLMQEYLQWWRDRPAILAAAGGGTGLATWLITHADAFLLAFQLIGGLFGALLTIISFLFVLPRLWRFFRNWRRNGFTRADVDTRTPRD